MLGNFTTTMALAPHATEIPHKHEYRKGGGSVQRGGAHLRSAARLGLGVVAGGQGGDARRREGLERRRADDGEVWVLDGLEGAAAARAPRGAPRRRAPRPRRRAPPSPRRRWRRRARPSGGAARARRSRASSPRRRRGSRRARRRSRRWCPTRPSSCRAAPPIPAPSRAMKPGLGPPSAPAAIAFRSAAAAPSRAPCARGTSRGRRAAARQGVVELGRRRRFSSVANDSADVAVADV